MTKIIITGGGWSGCAAAAQARKMGAEVVLLERTDMLLGTGLVGGIMRNNGRFTATEELCAMGGGDLFQVIDQHLRHRNINFPGHEHADLYDVSTMSPAIERYLREIGVEVHTGARVTQAGRRDREAIHITSVTDANGTVYEGDGFLDTTGTAGPTANCTKYGNGCAMCVLRCPSFGGRVSLTGLAGIVEQEGRKADGTIGAMSGSCKLMKESLHPDLVKELNEEGVVVVPIPEQLKEDHLAMKCCQQYALPQYKDNVILLDTGHAKLMAPYYDLKSLHKIPGFENARYEDPYAGGKGNSMRYFAMAPRDDTLQVKGTDNLFCAGEKAGLLVGHTEAIVTGVLAGCNCMRKQMGQEAVVLPRTTAIGEAVSYVREQMETEEGCRRKYTFSGSVLFERMKQMNLYTTNKEQIRQRIQENGLEETFA